MPGGFCLQPRALLPLAVSRLWTGLCSGLRVKRRFPITRGLCRARMGSERGLDGRSRGSANLINQVPNQPGQAQSRLLPSSCRGEPPASPRIQEQPGAVGGGMRPRASPLRPPGKCHPLGAPALSLCPLPSVPCEHPPCPGSSVPSPVTPAMSVWGFLERELVGMQIFLWPGAGTRERSWSPSSEHQESRWS